MLFDSRAHSIFLFTALLFAIYLVFSGFSRQFVAQRYLVCYKFGFLVRFRFLRLRSIKEVSRMAIAALELTEVPAPPWEAREGGDGRERARSVATLRTTSDRKPRVLIVDDDEAIRETLAELLEDDGFCTLVAGDAVEALTILRREAVVDALVTDLTMPGDDGIALIRQARAIDHDLPAILLTGHAEPVASIATTVGGDFHVLRKPIQGDRLTEQLKLLVAKPT
jgi:CheY-like chemotaxis protein